MNAPLVSILVPVYNVERYIERCVVSLLEQTYENIEYLFVDDCSSDSGIAILRSVIGRYPRKEKSVRILSHPINRGSAATRNTLLAAAKGVFLIYIDSDDYIDTRLVEKTVACQAANDADIVRYGYTLLNANGETRRVPPEISSAKELCLNTLRGMDVCVSVCFALIRRSLYNDNKIVFAEGCNTGEDYLASVLLSYHAQRVAVLSECLYYYDRTNNASYTFSKSKYPNVSETPGFCQTHELIRQFVNSIPDGEAYRLAFAEAEAQGLFGHMRSYALNGGDNKEQYIECRAKLMRMPSSALAGLPIRNRILAKIPSYPLAKICMVIVAEVGYWAKKLFGR